MIPGGVNLILAGGGEYEIANSLRFRASNSAFLSRTAGTPTSRTTWTGSFWVKRGLLTSVSKSVFGAMPTNGSAPYDYVSFSGIATDALDFYFASNAGGLQTTALFRDPAAWYHVVVVADTTQSQTSATASNSRLRLFVNGAQITNFTTATMPAQNTQSAAWNVSGTQNNIGVYNNGINLFGDMLLAEFNFIDGQALAASYFGQTDSATGVWVPKKYAGTYGNNGYYLKFADASAATAAAIGKDSSGNGNNWTPSGISVTSGVTFDQMTDTPTLNYPVLNSLSNGVGTLSAGNLKIVSATNSSTTTATFSLPNTGAFYWEITATDYISGGGHFLGVVNSTQTGTLVNGTYLSINTYNGGYTNGTTNDTTGLSGTDITQDNDVYGVAVDIDNNKFWVGRYRSGVMTWADGVTPAINGSGSTTISLPSGTLFPFIARGGSYNETYDFNFGQRSFASAAPTGFKALNSQNLATPSIKKGSLFFDATTRTGTGATASVSSLGFQPDLVWIKSRSAATNHNLFDSSRGATVGVITTGTGAEYTAWREHKHEHLCRLGVEERRDAGLRHCDLHGQWRKQNNRTLAWSGTRLHGHQVSLGID